MLDLADPFDLPTRAARARDVLARLADPPTAAQPLHRHTDGRILGRWYGLALASAFQPIVDGHSGVPAGYEAFLRSASADEHALSPWPFFASAADDSRLIALDRLARSLHLLNALAADLRVPLFLNVHGRLLASVADDHGRAFRRVVDAVGADPARIVIETPVEASDQPDLLAFVLRNYRHHGFQVAVNLASPAQWARLAGSVWPQYLKISARALGEGDAARAALGQLAAQREDTTLIVTRVETPLAYDADTDGLLWQGDAFGAPQARPSARR